MNRLKSQRPEKKLLDTISYFALFGFAPDFDQIFTYFPQKISKRTLHMVINRLLASHKLIRERLPATDPDPIDSSKQIKSLTTTRYSYLYTLPQYGIHLRSRAVRRDITRKKLLSVLPYLRALARLPVIRMVGLSGSAAMENCREGADVDLCIVTARNLLFTGRFLAILLAKLFSVHNPRHGVCLNLFFDEQDLALPGAKRSLYTAHEAAQMKPVIDKGGAHARFLHANTWMYNFLPNVDLPRQKIPPAAGGAKFFRPIELFLKKLQLAIIRKNRTGRLITPTQLWLFKKDYELKLRKTTIRVS